MSNRTTAITEGLNFNQLTPVAKTRLGGLNRTYFTNGRTFVSVSGMHGGLLDVRYVGRQFLGAIRFFQGDPGTGWHKNWRPVLTVSGQPWYWEWHDTTLFPFGMSSHAAGGGAKWTHELMTFPDAVVQRVKILQKPRGATLTLGMIHHEAGSRIQREDRTWSAFAYDADAGALVASCRDLHPEIFRGDANDGCLSQRGLKLELVDAPDVTTWIGLGSDLAVSGRSKHELFKLYAETGQFTGSEAAWFLVFAHSREELLARLAYWRKNVHRECEKSKRDYFRRVEKERPQITVSDPVLASAFTGFPERLRGLQVPDVPGAVRAGAWSFCWGWDGLTPPPALTLANEAGGAAEIFRYFQRTLHPEYGIPLSVTTDFQLRLKEPFPSQAQFIANLYQYVSVSGDLALAREVWPVCRFIIDKCRALTVGDTGLVAGNALWPDFPECMDENGHDISSLNNSLLYQGLRAAEFLGAAIGETAVAADCGAWAKKLRASFQQHLFDADRGYFVSSADARDFTPRRHYCCQAVYWLTPFAYELVAHAPRRVAAFMRAHLRTDKCLLSVPRWDTAWMADGNQIGGSYPPADSLFLGVGKLAGDERLLEAWLDDVQWYWRRLTTPEALTPEGANEAWLGSDNEGNLSAQSCSTWYTGLYHGLAGLDFDHEGLTVTPWGSRRVTISGLLLRGVKVTVNVSGRGNQLGSLQLNGRPLPVSCRKILWSQLKGKTARIDIVRTAKKSSQPAILRADGLRVKVLGASRGTLTVSVSGAINGEVLAHSPKRGPLTVNGRPLPVTWDDAGNAAVPYTPADGELRLELR
ncbi:MAG: hypothetical protein LBK76_04755 [Verrucomicrobiales bacterium]|nr:hypothetical protein [Verrucomicrobiales bacterium]